jgi:hypothetical protein
MAMFLGPGLGGGESAQPYSVALVLYFLIAGFLGGYLWTRLVLAGAFQSAEVQALTQRVQRVEETVRPPSETSSGEKPT